MAVSFNCAVFDADAILIEENIKMGYCLRMAGDPNKMCAHGIHPVLQQQKPSKSERETERERGREKQSHNDEKKRKGYRNQGNWSYLLRMGIFKMRFVFSNNHTQEGAACGTIWESAAGWVGSSQNQIAWPWKRKHLKQSFLCGRIIAQRNGLMDLIYEEQLDKLDEKVSFKWQW